MPVTLDPCDYEEASSLISNILSGKKGNASDAAAAYGDALMGVANRMDKSKKTHPRTVPTDATFSSKSRHGQALLVKLEEDFHNESMEFQENQAYAIENARENINTFLCLRGWSKRLIKEYWVTGGLIVLLQLIFQYYVYLLQHVTRQIDQYGWDKGSAQPNLAFYCDKLLKIFTHSNNKLLMFLRFYI